LGNERRGRGVILNIRLPVTLNISYAVYEVVEMAAKFSGTSISQYISELVREDCLRLKDHDMDLFSDWIKEQLKDEDWGSSHKVQPEPEPEPEPEPNANEKETVK